MSTRNDAVVDIDDDPRDQSPQNSPKPKKKPRLSAENPAPPDPDDVRALETPLWSIVCDY